MCCCVPIDFLIIYMLTRDNGQKKINTMPLTRTVQIIDEVGKFQSKKKSAMAAEFQVQPSTSTVVLNRTEFQSGTVDPSAQRQQQTQHAEIDRELSE